MGSVITLMILVVYTYKFRTLTSVGIVQRIVTIAGSLAYLQVASDCSSTREQNFRPSSDARQIAAQAVA